MARLIQSWSQKCEQLLSALDWPVYWFQYSLDALLNWYIVYQCRVCLLNSCSAYKFGFIWCASSRTCQQGCHRMWCTMPVLHRVPDSCTVSGVDGKSNYFIFTCSLFFCSRNYKSHLWFILTFINRDFCNNEDKFSSTLMTLCLYSVLTVLEKDLSRHHFQSDLKIRGILYTRPFIY